MEKILSNEDWFVRLVFFRALSMLILILAALLLVVAGDGWIDDQSGLWRAIVISLLLVATLWQWLQRPAYLEVITHENALLLRIYIPESRFLFILRRTHIRTFLIHPEDELRVHGQFSRWPWNRKLQFVIGRPDGTYWRSEVMDVSWATHRDWERLQGLPKLLCA